MILKYLCPSSLKRGPQGVILTDAIYFQDSILFEKYIFFCSFGILCSLKKTLS